MDFDGFDFFVSIDLFGKLFSNELVGINVAWNGFGGVATSDTNSKGDASLLGFPFVNGKAWIVSFFIGSKDILSNIYKTASEVAGVGGTESRRDLTLTSTTSGNERFEGVEAFL